MKRNWMNFGMSMMVLATAGSAFAQKDPNPDDPGDGQHLHVFQQPWTPPAAAHASRVFDCQNPVPMPVAAADDFQSQQDGFVFRVRWWGTLSAAAQAQRPFYIAFYDDNNCTPGNLLYETCVVPQAQFVQMNCNNRPVYTFRANVPAFPVAAGQRYWLRIAEDDANSLNVGADDFRWAGRQPVRGCPAVQCNGNDECQRLQDPCNNQMDDLSFNVLIYVP